MYFDGQNKDPNTCSLQGLADKLRSIALDKAEEKKFVLPAPIARSDSTSSNRSTGSASISAPPVAIKQAPVSRVKPSLAELKEATYDVSDKRQAIDGLLKTNPFKHTSGSALPTDKEKYWYKVQRDSKDVFNCRNIRVNNKFYAMPWKTGGGSAVHVQRLDQKGRMPDKPFCLHGHKQQVTTFDLNWLDEHLFASGAGDGVVHVYKIPENGLTNDDLAPSSTLKCSSNGRLVVANWSQNVSNLLATADTGADGHIVRLWNVEHETEGYCGFDLHQQIVLDVAFDFRSVLIATVSKDGTCKIIDPRADAVVQTIQADNTVKDPQVLFVDDDMVIILGADKTARRSVDLWDITGPKKLASFGVGMDSATMLPHFDYDTKMLFLGHYGGRQVQILSITRTAPYIEELNRWTTTDMTGLAFFHKTAVDVKSVEIAKCLKLGREDIIPHSFSVPRKRTEFFQDDLFPPTHALEAICSAREWFNGEHKEGKKPSVVSLHPADMTPLSQAPEEELTTRQLRYKEQLLKEDEVKPVSHMGHSSTDEVRQHFQAVARDMPTRNRFDAAPVGGNEVDDSEWD